MSTKTASAKVHPIAEIKVQPVGHAPEEQATLLGEVSIVPSSAPSASSTGSHGIYKWFSGFLLLFLLSLIATEALDDITSHNPPEVWLYTEELQNFTRDALSTAGEFARYLVVAQRHSD